MFGETSAKAFSVHVSIDIAAPFHGSRCVEHFLDADFGDHVRMRADDNAARRDFAQHRVELCLHELVAVVIGRLPDGLIAALVMLFIGGLAAYTFVWDLGDVGIGLMTIFNIIILYPQGEKALKELKEYEKEKRK